MREFISLPDLAATHARVAADRVALAVGETEITWGELDDRVAGLAAGLQALGVSRGDRVGAHIKEPIAFVELLLAVLRLGAAFVPLPTNLREEAVLAIVVDCGPAIVVADAALGAPDSGASGAAARTVSFDVLQAADGSVRSIPPPFPDDVASILYSSGTTSVPKGAAHTQRARFATQARFIKRFGLTPSTVTMLATPLYTSLTWASLLPTLAAGGKTVLMKEFEPREFLSLAKRQSATLAMMVPTQYSMLSEVQGLRKSSFSTFEWLISAGAKLDARLYERMMPLTGGKLVELLGSTETDAICCLPPDAPRSKWGSVGVPLDGVTIGILGDGDRILEAGGTGQIVAHSSSLMSGYHGSAAKAGNVFWTHPDTGDRYYRMGDLGDVDDDGYLWVRGRSNETIISAGFNIYPADIESVLLQHPSVREAAVIGAGNAALGEVPLAFVTVAERGAPSPSELCRWVNARVNDKQRVYAVRIIAQMPRNAMGKTQKSTLRDLCRARS